MDKTGWDHIIEFPVDKEVSTPTDLHRMPMECRVQVKATYGKSKSVDVKLSNMQRMVTNPIPYFFCFIEYSENDVAESYYVLHVDKGLMEKTLKRLCEHDAKNSRGELNKEVLSVSFKNQERLDLSFNSSLKEALIKHCPNGIHCYVEEKQKLIDSLGYEENSKEMTLTPSSSDPQRAFNRFMLGMENLDVDTCRFFDTRFNLKREVTTPLSGSNFTTESACTASLVGTGQSAIMEFRRSKVTKGIKIEATYRASPLYASARLDSGEPFMRFLSTYFEVLMYAKGKANITWSLGKDKISTVQELHSFLSLFNEFNLRSKLYIKITGKGLPELGFMAIDTSDIKEEGWGVFRLSGILLLIMENLSVDPTKTFITYESLLNQQKTLHRIQRLIYGHENNEIARLSYCPDEAITYTGKKIAVMHLECIVLNEERVGIIFALCSKDNSYIDNELVLDNSTIEFKASFILDNNEKSGVDARVLFELHHNELEDEGYDVKVFDGANQFNDVTRSE